MGYPSVGSFLRSRIGWTRGRDGKAHGRVKDRSLARRRTCRAALAAQGDRHGAHRAPHRLRARAGIPRAALFDGVGQHSDPSRCEDVRVRAGRDAVAPRSPGHVGVATSTGGACTGADRSASRRSSRAAGPWLGVERAHLARRPGGYRAWPRVRLGPSCGRAAAVLGDRYEASLMIVAIGGRARPLVELLLGLRAEAQRRGLDDASFYVSNGTQRRAARSAGYRRPWSQETYLFEKRL